MRTETIEEAISALRNKILPTPDRSVEVIRAYLAHPDHHDPAEIIASGNPTRLTACMLAACYRRPQIY